MRTRTLVFSLLATALVLIAASSDKRIDPRSLPSLRIAWKWDGSANEVVLKEGNIFALEEHGITALDATTGTVLWEKKLGSGDDIAAATPLPLSTCLATAFGSKVYLLNKKNGNIVHSIDLTHDVTGLTGPPLIAWIDREVDSELVKIDEVSGKIQQRKTLPNVREFERDEGIIVTASHWSSDGPARVFGLRDTDLSEIWNVEIQNFAEFTRINGKLFVSLYPDSTSEQTKDWDKVFAPFNSKTGQVGDSLPRRDPSQLSSSSDTWVLQLVNTDDQTGTSTIRRNDPKTGKAIWSKTFPCALDADLQESNTLYIHCSSGSGRGYFEVLNWNTGKTVSRAYGLRDVRNLIKSGNNLLATSYGSGIVAFSATEFGPPESATTSISVEVHRLLLAKELTKSECWWEDMDASVKDLKDLGDRALPFITAEIPKLSPAGVAVAARVLSDAGYRSAASELASRFPELKPCSDLGWAQHNPPIAVLQSLAKIGGKTEVEAIGKVLFDNSRSGEIRREAFASLVSIGDEEILDILESAIVRLTPKPHDWWLPPDPGKYFARLGTPVGREEIRKAYDDNDYERAQWLDRAQASVRLRNKGSDLILFPYEGLGGQADLWLIEVGSSGPLSQARFLGISAHGEMIVRENVQFKAELNGRNVMIVPPNGKTVRLDLSGFDVDSDGDGLTDITEKRLRTNAMRKDTDGDGLIDSKDLAPNSRQAASTEQELITAAIFQQYFMFTNSVEREVQLAVMISESALEWNGRSGPTITLSEVEDKAFLQEAGYNGVPHIYLQGWIGRGIATC